MTMTRRTSTEVLIRLVLPPRRYFHYDGDVGGWTNHAGKAHCFESVHDALTLMKDIGIDKDLIEVVKVETHSIEGW